LRRIRSASSARGPASSLRREQKTVGMIAIGNSKDGYSVEHQETLEAIAPAIVAAIDRKGDEAALRQSRKDLHFLAVGFPEWSQPRLFSERHSLP
jgi:GAF domain-containing protein